MKHHDEALAGYIARTAEDPDALGVIVTGSLARGTERPDSDVDLYLVVTEDAWQRAFAAKRLMFVERDGADYPGGYFDIKLATLEYLSEAASHGDDPVRDSFAVSYVAWSRLDDLADRVASIATVDDSHWAGRTASFIAQARLHGGYFLVQGEGHSDPVLLHHAAVHLATSASRAFLADARVFYRGAKYISAALRALPNIPKGFAESVDELLAAPTAARGTAVLDALEAALGAALPEEETLSTFVLDNELAWRYRTAPPEYS